MNLVLSFIKNMLSYMLAACPLIAVGRLLSVRRMKRMGLQTSGWHEAGVWVFALFLVGLLSQAVVPKFEMTSQGLRVVGGLFVEPLSHLNLIPGRVLWETYQDMCAGEWSGFQINFLGNILMFMPIGFFPPLLWRRFESRKMALLAGLGLSLLIELCQLPFIRMTDVDDLWLNTFGAFYGYLFYRRFQQKGLVTERWKVGSQPDEKNCQKSNRQAGKRKGMENR